MSTIKWERPLDAALAPESDPNSAAPPFVFGPMSTAVERGWWMGVDGPAGSSATIQTWVQVGTAWYLLSTDTIDASTVAAVVDPIPDGLTFTWVLSAVVGLPTRLFGGTEGPGGMP